MTYWYEVESLYFNDDWENDFQIDGEPARFNTLEEAQEFLKSHLADELEAYNEGSLDDLTEADDYRIVKITKEPVST